MTFESNYLIAIATLRDWLKRCEPFFSTNEKQNQNQSRHARVSRTLRELQVISRNCDWFIALFAPVMIGRRNCFGFGFSTDLKTALYQHLHITYACCDLVRCKIWEKFSGRNYVCDFNKNWSSLVKSRTIFLSKILLSPCVDYFIT